VCVVQVGGIYSQCVFQRAAHQPSSFVVLCACLQVVIELVLATDMKQHFSILSHFTTVHRLNAGGGMTPGTSGSDPMLALRQQAR
jgi:hypothetical protein